MSINSKVLALKYRPQNLKQIIGQNVITETVYNSIKLNKVPNAYLFTGIRGCLLYTSPSPRDRQKCRMPSSA